MTTKTSCSWCHTLNETTRRMCEKCGHDAHVPRSECQCLPCRGLDQVRIDAGSRERNRFLRGLERKERQR